MQRILSLAFMVFTLLVTNHAHSFELWCKVERKLNEKMEYKKDYIEEQKFGLFIRHWDTGATLSRCSGNSACDEYQVDHIEFTENVGMIKYYYFKGHFDVQLFADLRFIENNGRGDIAWGQCWEQ